MATLRTIGEVAESLDLPQHVLRFWETRFKEIDPVKRAGGRRFYRPRDIELVEAIRHLLYREGYTIKGVQRILKEQGVDAVIEDVSRRQSGEPEAPPPLPATEPSRQATLDLPEPSAPSVVTESPIVLEAPAMTPAQEEAVDESAQATGAPVAEDIAAESDHPHSPIFHAPAVVDAPVVVTRRLDEKQARTLREALAEIEECKRLLNLTRR